MSLVVTSLVVGGLVLVAGTTVAMFRRRRQANELPAPPVAPRASPAMLARGFAAEVGDVVSLNQGEFWLEDAWLLSENEPVAAAYFARDVVLVLLPQPSEFCYRLTAISLQEVGDVPSVLEYEGQRYERKRRRPVSVEAQGDVPPPFSEALLAEYEGLADTVLWLLLGGDQRLAWFGRRSSVSDFERWGPGER
jgi:hypothetical protein